MILFQLLLLKLLFQLLCSILYDEEIKKMYNNKNNKIINVNKLFIISPGGQLVVSTKKVKKFNYFY